MNLKLYKNKSPNYEDNPDRANLPGPLENYRNVTRMSWGKGWANRPTKQIRRLRHVYQEWGKQTNKQNPT